MALPYVTLQGGGGGGFIMQPFGMILLASLVAGGFAVAIAGKRVKVGVGESAALAGICVGAAFILAHIFDVAWYRLGHGPVEPATWIKLFDGISLFGGLAGVAIVVVIWTQARRLSTAVYADLAAIGCCVANTLGRVGCALVHDHAGVRTELPIGVDFPAEQVHWLGFRDVPRGDTVRLHDLGLEELALMIPLTIAVLLVFRRRPRAGTVAAVAAIGYAVLRFPLDFLRLPELEPTRLGLTAGQLGSIVMALVAIGFVALRGPATGRAASAP